jgi:hypothetical protein
MQVELHIQPGPMTSYDQLASYAQRAVKLQHPALVKIHEVGIDANGSAVVITPAAQGISRICTKRCHSFPIWRGRAQSH